MKKNLPFHNFRRASGENFSKRLSKLHSNIPEEHCWRIFLFEKIYKFMILLGCGVKTYWQDSTLSEQPLKRNCLFAKNYRFKKISSSFGSKVCGIIDKIAVLISWGTFLEKTFARKKLWVHNCFSVYGWKLFNRIVRTAF